MLNKKKQGQAPAASAAGAPGQPPQDPKPISDSNSPFNGPQSNGQGPVPLSQDTQSNLSGQFGDKVPTDDDMLWAYPGS